MCASVETVHLYQAMVKRQDDESPSHQTSGLTYPILHGQKYVCDGNRCVRLPTKYEIYLAMERAAVMSGRLPRIGCEAEDSCGAD
ncbi:unnamed protein product [Dibothriocephalus latus]|uniref:Uncharacterized protein n=1 Tax=Dibothriocephalus latus TaxID=60516 RepID=A0A3P7LTP2_DIBLA|nr:unnamed protein product [Dibothriocephalus latus]